ncbi:arylsulfatase B-like [Mya arenaria]|uniref:arylsulfatase B-like n=1 Tax=Mya arenaria TaxID=6604 RepID=UPI0022DF58C6|nr:arylsulfatase B-like [Mya arenaria]XP_052794796.1 arylsulfatase B-like [Mya arenaria]
MLTIIWKMFGDKSLLLIVIVSLTRVSNGKSERPHVIIIVADDLGWNDVSFHGSNQIPTPNIDKLAHAGIILNNYYVSPICTPTRGALMTGKYPIHTGLQSGVILGSMPYGLPLKEKILPQWLADLGYRTHIVGKWHLGMLAEEYLPTRRGFESHYGYLQGAEGYYDHTYEFVGPPNSTQWGLDWRRNDEVVWTDREQYSTSLFTREAVNLINAHNDSEPLFLYVAHQAVHCGNPDDPLEAPQSYVNRFPHIHNYHRKLFAGMVSTLDDSVGEIVRNLEDRGMLDNSVILFTTDNGGPANGFNDNAANNFPLRGVKATLWEGGMRGTGFIHSPLLKQSGYVSTHMIHVTDWLPTLYSAAGGKHRNLKHLDGYNMWHVLSKNSKSPRNEILHNIDPLNKKSSIRVGDLKLLVGNVNMQWDGWYPPWQNAGDQTINIDGRAVPLVEGSKHDKVLDTYKWKNSYWNSSSIDCGNKPFNASTNCNPSVLPCLFNIAEDPCEYNNLADSNKDLVIKMLEKLSRYSHSMIPPGNKPIDPAGDPKLHNQTWVPWIKL